MLLDKGREHSELHFRGQYQTHPTPLGRILHFAPHLEVCYQKGGKFGRKEATR